MNGLLSRRASWQFAGLCQCGVIAMSQSRPSTADKRKTFAKMPLRPDNWRNYVTDAG